MFVLTINIYVIAKLTSKNECFNIFLTNIKLLLYRAGRAWLYHTLSEGSFESYLGCLLRDTKTLKKQYFSHALVRDADKTNQLVNLLAGLENVSFTLQLVC